MDVVDQNTAISPDQVGNFQVFRRLSDQCSPVIEKKVQEIRKFMTDRYVRAVIVSGWEGIAKETIVKYAAKRAMESNLFNILIWVTGQKRDLSLKEFQIQIADKLLIPSSRNDKDDEEETVDYVLAGKIHECLEKKKFLLVHDGGWGFQDLSRIGIPNIRSGNYSMILVIYTSTSRRYHELVSITNRDLPEKDACDLLREESKDISDALSLKRVHITPEIVMDCILYFLLFEFGDSGVEIQIQSLFRCWLAEGFIGDNISELETNFALGMALLQELKDREIIDSNDTLCFKRRSTMMTKLRGVITEGTLLPCTYVLATLTTLNTFRLEWENIDKISIWMTDEFPLSPPNCPKLSTIISYGKYYPPKLFTDNFFQHMENLRVLIIINSVMSTLPSSLMFCKNLKMLKLENCKSFNYLEVPYLRALGQLEVLDLSSTPLEGMHDSSFEGLENLRLLDLSNCYSISSLPSSTAFLLSLEMLLLGGCRSLSILPSCTVPLKKLQMLDLSRTDLVKIPENLFLQMNMLKHLNLSFMSLLTSLPMSMSNLVNLKSLNLESCTSLTTVVPGLPNLALSLEVLNISGCSSLRGSTDLVEIFNHTANLQVLSLNSLSVNFLSLNRCSNLETINLGSNTNLELLDLSYTKIKSFPLEGNPDVRSLKHLNLVGVKNLRDVNWKVVAWLPQQVNWMQSGDGRISQMLIPQAEWCTVGKGIGAFISVEDANIFQSLTPESSLWENGLSCFLIFVCRSMESGKRNVLSTPTRFYADIYSRLKPHVPLYKQCLEIKGGKRFPKGIAGVLSHTQFLYLHDENNVVKLSDFGIENFDELKECWLERCSAMKVLFDIETDDLVKYQLLLRALEKIRISRLMKLRAVCISRGMLGNGSFSCLQHLQIEYCPRLVTIFSSTVSLDKLEVLKVKFCARLEEIFSGEVNDKGCLRRLHTLCLLELPALTNIIHNAEMPALNMVQIRRCPKLHKLPIRKLHISIKDALVVVTCEPEWWERLEWMEPNTRRQFHFNTWHPFKIPRGG